MKSSLNGGFTPEISFNISQLMKNAGIIDLKLIDKDLIFSFNQGRKVSLFISRKTGSVSKISNTLRKRLKNIIKEDAIREIEDQLIDRRDEIFRTESNEVSQIDNTQSNILNNVISLRQQYRKSGVTYDEWQQYVKEKYIGLRKVTLKNFPEAWPLLQFSLAVKSILNIDGCNLPFMGVILAIPSSMKTLVIQLFRKYFRSLYSDNFTPNSFESHNAALSEEQLQKVDLLPKLNNKLFLTPELAPIFTANEDELRKTLGIFTRILDGHGLETDSGAQGHRRYGNTFFVWIGAAVEIPYRVWRLLGTLGHKFYAFRPDIPEKTITELEKIAKENNFQSKFKEVEDALLDYFTVMESIPETNVSRIDENGIAKIKWNENHGEEQNKAISCLAHLANLVKRLRGTVYVSESKTWRGHTSYYKSNDEEKSDREPTTTIADGPDYDTDYPITEDPSRAVILLRNLAIGNAISQGRDYISLEDIPLIINVALSTTTRARSELIRLLFRNNGELTTSTIVIKSKVSAPFAKKTMRELGALGIVEISPLSGYNNSELKISLKDEYIWFKSKEFQDLFNNHKNTSELDRQTIAEISNNDNKTVIAISFSGQYQLPDDDCSLGSSGQALRNDDNLKLSHAETKSTSDAHKKYYDTCDRFNENKSSDCTSIDGYNESFNNNSNQLLVSKSIYSNDTETCDEELKSKEKNNMPVWGSKSFQRVTLSQTNLPTTDLANEDFQKQQVLQLILDAMKNANNSIVSIADVLQSLYNKNEIVRIYLGDKLTQRENRKVRELYLDIIHNKNVGVIKYKPQLLVNWKSGGAP